MQNKLQAYLDSVKERVDAATVGPWEPDECTGFIHVFSKFGVNIADTRPGRDFARGSTTCYHNTKFIAAAHTDVEILLAMVERLKKELDQKLIQARQLQLGGRAGMCQVVMPELEQWLEALIPTKEGEL